MREGEKHFMGGLAVLKFDIDGLKRGTLVHIEDTDGYVVTIWPTAGVDDGRRYKAFASQLDPVTPACEA
jgi:hypothetical protein